MKVMAMLAEAVTAHPDGTVSMLRAGINRISNKVLPVILPSASLLVSIEAEAGDGSLPNTFEVRIIDEDGKDIAPRLPGKFNVPEGGGTHNLILNFQGFSFPRYGRYQFTVAINNMRKAEWTVTVKQPEDKLK